MNPQTQTTPPPTTGQAPSPSTPEQAPQPVYQPPPPPTSQPPSVPPYEMPHKGKRRFMPIVIGVVIVLLLFFAFLFFNYHRGSSELKNAKAVSDSFMQDLVANKPDAAYKLTSTNFRKVSTEADVATFFSKYKNASFKPYNEASWQLTLSNGSANSAVTQYTLTSPNVTSIDTITMQKIGGQWQVTEFHSSK